MFFKSVNGKCQFIFFLEVALMETRTLIIGSLVITLILSLGAGCAQTPVKKDGGVPVIKPAIDIPGSGDRPGGPVKKDGNVTVIGQAVDLFSYWSAGSHG